MSGKANKTVVLINPRATYVNEIAQKCYPPSSLLYLASALREHGFNPVVLEANAFGMSDEQIAEKVKELKPLVVGLSLYSDILKQVHDITEVVRRAWSSSRIVLGGPHATAVPVETLEQYGDADYVLAGECEKSLCMLCEEIVKANVPANVPGIFYRDKERVVEGPAMRFEQIDEIAVPAKDLVERAYKQGRYYTILVRERPVDTLFTSRGCPFSCGFCYNFRFDYRGRSPERVVEELVSIRDRGIRDVEICDDTFTAVGQRALKIFDLIIKEKLDVSFRIKSRVDVFTEELAKKAKRAGVYLVSFGMESGSQRMLDAMNKKITVEQSARACALTKKYDMLSHSSWVIGYPGESMETVNDTYNFIRKNHPSTVNLSVVRPYPGTAVYEAAKADGSLMGSWDAKSQHIPWIRLEWAPEKKVLDDLRTKLLRRIYFSPYYMSSFAGRIIRNMNWYLARYAMQETGKIFGINRKSQKRR